MITNSTTKGTDMEYYTAIGIDVSDKTSKICVMAKSGGKRRIVLERTVETTKEGFRSFLGTLDRSWPVTFETGVHCRWMHDEIGAMGFKVFVANPAKLKQLTESNTKNDTNDARELARFTLADVELLHPVFIRPEPYQQMLRLLKARDLMLGIRTKLINEMRGFAKSMGFRLPKTDAGRFHKLDRSSWPTEFETLAFPMIDVLETLAVKIRANESQMRELAGTETFANPVARCREVYGVGFFTAAAFVALLGGNVERFAKAKDIGPYLGLVPKQDQSGEVDKQCSITKAGCEFMRSMLTECAQVAMKDSAAPSDLKLKAWRICASGGPKLRKCAVSAVARDIAVTMLALLKHPEREYKALSEDMRIEWKADFGPIPEPGERIRIRRT